METVEQLLSKAEAGDVRSCFELGQAYALGNGVDADIDAATAWYRRAAVGGHVLGAYMTGAAHLDGSVAKDDWKEATMWFLRAFLKGNADAAVVLSTHYATHESLTDRELIDYFTSKANEGDADAAYTLGRLSELSVGSGFDPSKVYGAYKRAAEMGSIYGRHALALCILNGCGVTRNREEGVSMLRELADEGLPEAVASLAKCYEYGTGVEKDQKMAFDLYEKMVDLGSALGMYHMGRCYMDGVGVEKDANYSYCWYVMAASKGSREGLYGLARCNMGGIGLDKNKDRGMAYLNIAADHGNRRGFKAAL